jgi:aspartyl/glutamyl-tRNA(Asn/Gln) amidotransferase C subunit
MSTKNKRRKIMITKEDLVMLCELSRLQLSEEELESYGKSMTEIMRLMDTIGESDFEYNLVDMNNAVPFASLRADEVVDFENMDKIVENGPQTVENQFVVPKVVD